ncbi:MAG: Asp-tRNA(Asn)/Glu-tRNA(Gln) amidotransferase subunit GatA [bacterium]|nr:Asp-tRNA(Asn)/Glu-tRNA(Gln) amidotransferase subunit GatA [bacterium]
MIPDSVKSAWERIAARPELNAFAEVYDEPAYEEGVSLEAPLYGVPVAVKDNICVKGKAVTCASSVLQGFTSAYDAEAVARLKKAGAIIIGRANMDEFAMGSATETSVYGASRCPYDTRLVAGGSSGGSAAAVGAGLVPVALGSDTGGSVRLPSAFCGVLGLRPSYGLVSRRGLVAFSSTLDAIGISATSAMLCLKTLSCIVGEDKGDMTLDSKGISIVQNETGVLEKLWSGNNEADSFFGGSLPVLAVPAEWEREAQPSVKAYFNEAVKQLSQLFTVKTVSFPYYDEALRVYDAISSAECYSNLARYDGIRYGARACVGSWQENIKASRDLFGEEVKRRLEKGSRVLADSGAYEQACAKMLDISDYMNKILENADFILTPTAARMPFAPGALSVEEMRRCDIFTIPATLAKMPAISLPLPLRGADDYGFLCGLHITCKRFADINLLRLAGLLEKRQAM